MRGAYLVWALAVFYLGSIMLALHLLKRMHAPRWMFSLFNLGALLLTLAVILFLLALDH